MFINSSNKRAIAAGNSHQAILRLIHWAKQLGDHCCVRKEAVSCLICSFYHSG